MRAENIVCVKCTSVLDKTTIAEVEVDLCPKCGGIWLDKGEITRLANLEEANLEGLRAQVNGPLSPPPVPCDTSHHCPACPGALKEVLLGAIHVDYCPTCHGIFLDRGELDTAVATVRDKGGSTKQVLAATAKSVRDSMF